MSLTINHQDIKGVTILELRGKLIFGEECDAFNQQIKDLQDADKAKIVLKLEGVKYCDSAGLDGLVRARRQSCRQPSSSGHGSEESLEQGQS